MHGSFYSALHRWQRLYRLLVCSTFRSTRLVAPTRIEDQLWQGQCLNSHAEQLVLDHRPGRSREAHSHHICAVEVYVTQRAFLHIQLLCVTQRASPRTELVYLCSCGRDSASFPTQAVEVCVSKSLLEPSQPPLHNE